MFGGDVTRTASIPSEVSNFVALLMFDKYAPPEINGFFCLKSFACAQLRELDAEPCCRLDSVYAPTFEFEGKNECVNVHVVGKAI